MPRRRKRSLLQKVEHKKTQNAERRRSESVLVPVNVSDRTITVIVASHHQGSSIYPETSRGKQCCAMSFMSILFSAVIPPAQWTLALMDSILSEGDTLYHSLPHNYDYVEYSELPVLLHSDSRNTTFRSVIGQPISGLHSSTDVAALREALQEGCCGHTGCLLTTHSFTIAVIQTNNTFRIFDSHSRGNLGLPTADGTAICIPFNTLEDIGLHISNLYQIVVPEQFDVVSIDTQTLLLPNPPSSLNERPGQIVTEQLPLPTVNDRHDQMATYFQFQDEQQDKKRKILYSELANKSDILNHGSFKKRIQTKDALRKKMKRSSFTENEIKQQKIQDAARKSKRIQEMTPSEKAMQDQNDAARKKSKRSSRTEEEIKQQTLQNAARMKRKRSTRTEEEIKQQTLQNAARMKRKRSTRTEDEIKQQTLQNAARMKSKRSTRTEEEIKQQTLQNAAKMKSKRSTRTEEEIKQQTLQDAARKKSKRSTRTEEEIKQQTLQDAARKKSKRSTRTEEEIKQQTLQNAARMKSKRSTRTEEEIKQQTLQNAARMKSKRNTRTEEEIKQQTLQNAARMKSKRSTRTAEEIKQQTLQDAARKKSKRSTRTEFNDIETGTDAIRICHSAVKNVLKTFFTEVAKGPTCRCVSCGRMMYRSAVVKFHENTYDENILQTVLTPTELTSLQNNFICTTCHKYMKQKTVPPQAQANMMRVPPVPQVLQRLCDLEKQLICRILPFMRIVSLPKSGQHGLKGSVVLVPADLEKTAVALPRNISDSQIITLSLKRRISDKHCVTKELIRPNFVNEALDYLKFNNIHYQNILMNRQWVSDSIAKDPELWSAVEAGTVLDDVAEEESGCEPQNVTGENDSLTDSEDEVEKDMSQQDLEELQESRGINCNTLLYPEEGPTVHANQILNLAPAEGQIPVSVYHESNWEAMAFPYLFPDGKYSFSHDRSVRLTPKKYVNARLLSQDGRFAENTQYIFQCLHWIELKTVKDSVSMCLKKLRQGDISAGQLNNPERITQLMKDDEAFASFKKVRGSPQYWKDMQFDMLAKVRQLGPYTFFITGSAAEFHWPEIIQIVARQYGKDLSFDEIKAMDWCTKRRWIASNPVTVARHIDYIFRQLWNKVILSGVHPVGQILNYDVRKEIQARGTEHFHSAVHVKDAPKLDHDPDKKVEEYIDRYISCAVPSETEDSELRDLVLSRQRHRHTGTCKKNKNVACRFHYPRPPSNSTLIARKPDGEDSKSKITSARTTILKVLEALTRSPNIDMTMTDALKEADITEEQYSQACQVSSKRTSIILKRKPSEIFINNYNPILLKALRSNMDIQFITDIWACIAYLTSYMCKPERTMSELMRKAAKEANTLQEKLNKIGNVFLKSREVSEHEAIARLLGLPLRDTNTSVQFVQTGLQSERTRMLKPPDKLSKLDDDDRDVFLPSILDKYPARPDSLEDLCLADFVANYSPVSESHSQEHEAEAANGGDITDNCQQKGKRNRIKLKNDMGTMYKRQKPCVIRYHFISKERDAERYFHRLLILYLPWRKEEELLSEGSYELKYSSVAAQLHDKISSYEPNQEELEVAMDSFDSNMEVDQEVWDRLAPQMEQNREDDAEETEAAGSLDPDLVENVRDEDICTVTTNPTPNRNYSVSSQLRLAPDNKYFSLIQSLNSEQRRVHDFISEWATNCRQSDFTKCPPEPFYLFLSGGGGVGKSHTIHAIHETVVRSLRTAGDNPEKPKILLTASTGKAASNIGGTTLHSAFSLPVRQKGQAYQYIKPSAQKLNTMRAMYVNLKIIIADEISMFGGQALSNLNCVMQDIFESNLPFGGMSVLAVGDLLQLNPVGDRPVFAASTRGYGSLAGSIWQQLFKLHELKEIIRQQGDPDFASLLAAVRIGEHNRAHVDTLKTLENNHIPEDCVSVFVTNAQVHTYNQLQLNKLTSPLVVIKAADTQRDFHTGRSAVTVLSENPHDTGGLHSQITVAIGARYMHTKNTDIADMLVNGATGTIVHLDIREDRPLKGTIYVKFDDSRVGMQAKKLSPRHLKHAVPITAVVSRFAVSEKASSVQVERKQFPGTLAWGLTVHKSQGSTYEQMVGDMSSPGSRFSMNPGQAYTMLSRVKSRQGLKLVAFDEKKIVINKKALQEMKRLRCSNLLEWMYPYEITADDHMTIIHLNVRSLNAHYADVKQEPYVGKSSVLSFTETHASRNSVYPLLGYQCLSAPTRHGISIYVSEERAARSSLVQVFDNESLEALVALVDGICITAVYIPPNSSWNSLSKALQELLEVVVTQSDKTVVMGDFNTSWSRNSRLTGLFSSHNLKQHITAPTHLLGNTLDLLFTNQEELHTFQMPVHFSDHQLIGVHFPLECHH